MLRYIAFLLLILTAFPALAANDADARYHDLLAKAKAGEPVDWQALRFAYADSSDFDLFGTESASVRKTMYEALKTEDFAAALAQANLILDQNYVDVDARFVSHMANSKLGNAEEAKKQYAIMIGILRSIHTGDGRTPETALTVIAVSEEYSYLRAIGLHRTHQALISVGGHSYDVLDVADRSGQDQKLYFLIDRVLAAEAASIAAKR